MNYKDNYSETSNEKKNEIESNVDKLDDKTIAFIQGRARILLEKKRADIKEKAYKEYYTFKNECIKNHDRNNNHNYYFNDTLLNNFNNTIKDIRYEIISLGHGYHDVVAYDKNGNKIDIVDSFHD